jgi:hypothetical protein
MFTYFSHYLCKLNIEFRVKKTIYSSITFFISLKLNIKVHHEYSRGE